MNTTQISIIVPVYSQWELTRRLLQSFEHTWHYERSKNSLSEILIVNDNPSDHDTAHCLREFCSTSALPLRLIENVANLGFVKSINVGLATASVSNDIIIANSDTEVFGGWLDGLVDTINYFTTNGISWGSLTPLSNAATIASVPEMGKEWRLADHEIPPSIIARVCSRIFAPPAKPLLLPTGVGFFMVMSRAALDITGNFSLDFSPGYGEETDWCLKAAALGYHSYVCPSVFIAHEGGSSFGDTKDSLLARGWELMRKKHPEYEPLVRAFIENPVNHHFHKVLKSLWPLIVAVQNKRAHLHLTNRDPFRNIGGLERYITELSRSLASDDVVSIVLFPGSSEQEFCLVLNAQEPIRLSFISLCWIFRQLIELDILSVHSFNIQHTHGWNLTDIHTLIDTVERSAELINFVVHDYSPLCRNHNLLWNGRSFCGAPIETSDDWCRSCSFGKDVTMHRAEFKNLLRRATSIIHASAISQSLIEKIFPELGDRSEICPLLEPLPSSSSPAPCHEKIAILFLGATGIHKGIHHFEKLARYFENRFRFITLGIEDYFGGKFGVMHRYYSYAEQNSIKQLLQDEFPAFAFLGSITAETFSFTAHECLEAGIPILTTANSGNICSILHRHQLGHEFHSLEALAIHLESHSDDELRSYITQVSREHELRANVAALRRVYLEPQNPSAPILMMERLVAVAPPAQIQ